MLWEALQSWAGTLRAAVLLIVLFVGLIGVIVATLGMGGAMLVLGLLTAFGKVAVPGRRQRPQR